MVKFKYNPKTVSERIKEERNKLGLNQVELAKQTEISINSIKSYESGRRIPDNYNLQRLANVLRVDPFYLLGETDFRSYLDRYDKEHPEEVKNLSLEVHLIETAEQLGFYSIDSENPEKGYSDFIKYIQQYKERKVNPMKKSDVKIILNSDFNEIRDNFETGEITIYAISESDVERAFEQLKRRGMIEE